MAMADLLLIAETSSAIFLSRNGYEEDVPPHYEPIGIVDTMGEALRLAAEDMRRRLVRVEAGDEVLCPEAYAVWGRTREGDYVRMEEILP